MKMDFFTSGIFWGVILVLIGLSIIIKIVFDINIPVLRILFALFLIYWGIRLIGGISFSKPHDNDTVFFSKEEFKYSKGKREYNTVFGKTSIDLSSLSREDTLKTLDVNVVFGSTDIFIDDSVPVRIKASSAFGSILFPDETLISFGERVYKTSAFKESEPHGEVRINVVFGSAAIRRRDRY